VGAIALGTKISRYGFCKGSAIYLLILRVRKSDCEFAATLYPCMLLTDIVEIVRIKILRNMEQLAVFPKTCDLIKWYLLGLVKILDNYGV
jgi:hypothetical protein